MVYNQKNFGEQLKQGKWLSAKGQLIPIQKLSNEHLESAVKQAKAKMSDAARAYKLLEGELNRRVASEAKPTEPEPAQAPTD